MKKLYERSSNTTSYSADPGEPDTGFIPGGTARTLGFESGKPEPWFHQLDFEQIEFPVASYVFGSKKADKKLAYTVKKSASVSDIKSILKDLDAEIEEIKDNTQQMYQDIKR